MAFPRPCKSTLLPVAIYFIAVVSYVAKREQRTRRSAVAINVHDNAPPERTARRVGERERERERAGRARRGIVSEEADREILTSSGTETLTTQS